jgi:2',3'-cyclic-nucleotide 2'-phosphodiesterase (5'-nucleotidase family)
MNFSSIWGKLLLIFVVAFLFHLSASVMVEALSVQVTKNSAGGASTPPNNALKQVTRGGGRSPSQPDLIQGDQDEVSWEQDSSAPDGEECRLIVLHITDVYTLQHLASFKTLVEETKKRHSKGGVKVVSILTGDFLSPYLLSSVDRGRGMMNALNKIPLDYLTWGNHEADIDHRTVCRHVRSFSGGKWINSNMLDHEAMESQQEYDVIQLEASSASNGRKHVRRVGLCAVLSNDPDLYSHFKPPGAFGGATITDPWEALRKYKDTLEQDEKCDLVLPLQHLYVPDDYKTCREFDFPVVISGHDHHRVDEVVEGTRLLKPGMNAVYATVLEISWKDVTSSQPNIRARFVKCDDWEPDPVLEKENERAYDALIPLRNTELARVPSTFEPLSSGDARGSVCTMG